MIATGLFDGSFQSLLSATLGGENLDRGPEHVRWARGAHGTYSTFYTDMCLEAAIGAPGLKVAWLIEPPSLQDNHYTRAVKLEDVFDYILTFHADYLDRGDKWLFYPCGGSWIKHWGLYRKTKQVSIIVSEKAGCYGHRLRHEIVKRYGDKLDVLGRGYKPIPYKTEGLAPYKYSIVIESIAMGAYFSEKLIDCFAVGTIPIYRGCPSIADFFNPDGIITFNSADELEDILDKSDDYSLRLEAARDNLERAREYACAEDWIYNHYGFLFEEQHG